MWKSPPALIMQGEISGLCLSLCELCIVLCRQGFLESSLGLLAGRLAAQRGLAHFCRFPSQADSCILLETQLHIYRKPVCPVSQSCLVLLDLICHFFLGIP